MLFNSFSFIVFFVIVFALYFAFQKNLRIQNRLLLLASYFFYGCWDWRFLSLILISTCVDFYCGLAIENSQSDRSRKRFLTLSLISNLGILGFFKYFNFFSASLRDFGLFFGWEVDATTLNIILPVGISFYTFQTLSYTLDICARKIKPTSQFLDFALYVAFFPQLVAGPIERASHLLPQILNPRKLKLDQFYEGCYLIGWGLFKKVFVADNLANLVNPVFENPTDGGRVLLAVYAFAFQIYCDFSGYSDIARGVGRCLGFDIMWNFNVPYFSKNPGEFWQRWHISLSGWLRDYLYIPLGGNRRGNLIAIRNVLITMLLGGLWHGASWTFVFWGFYHALLIIVYRFIQPILQGKSWGQGRLSEVLQIVIFFHLVCLGWLIFRAQTWSQMSSMAGMLFTDFRWSPEHQVMLIQLVFHIALLLGVQLWQRVRNDRMVILKVPVWIRVSFYIVGFYLFMILGATGGQEFIYFQF